MKIMSAKVKDFLYFLKKYYITCKKTMKTLFFELLASEIHYILTSDTSMKKTNKLYDPFFMDGIQLPQG